MAVVEQVNAKGARGWVAHDGTADARVSVLVNGLEVTYVTANQPLRHGGELRPIGFSRSLIGLWPYLDETDELTFEYDGRRLPIVGHGTSYRRAGPREKDPAELVQRIEDGWVLDRRGRLRPHFSASKRVRQYAHYSEPMRALVREKLGLELFPIYGTLLGCVREGQFIGHDNDIDLTYISKFSEPEQVRAEFIEFGQLLTDHGYRGVARPYSFVVRSPLVCDIYPAWVKDSRLNFTWGYHGEAKEWTPEMAVLSERSLGPLKVMVPVGAEQILAQIYGETWRVPDPAFTHKGKGRRTRKVSREYLASEEEIAPVYWSQFYRHNELVEGSTFSRFVEEQIAPHALVIDVGCGTGRDTTYFASKGFATLGVDASADGVKQGQERGVPGSRFVVADAGDAEALDAVFTSPEVRAAVKARRQVVVYLRFFLHAIPEETEATLLSAIARNLRTVTLAAEFRTTEDAEIPKAAQPHYRRFIDSSAFAQELDQRYGFTVEYSAEGTGLSVYKGEDPFLCRIIAKRAKRRMAAPAK